MASGPGESAAWVAWLARPMAAEHPAVVPKGEGQKGVVVVTETARTAVAMAEGAAAGRDFVFGRGFFHVVGWGFRAEGGRGGGI